MGLVWEYVACLSTLPASTSTVSTTIGTASTYAAQASVPALVYLAVYRLDTAASTVPYVDECVDT